MGVGTQETYNRAILSLLSTVVGLVDETVPKKVLDVSYHSTDHTL